MKTVAFVPIKLNNERFPGKNTKCFDDGTPLVQIVLKKLVKLKDDCIDEIYVFCSDEAIIPYMPDGVTFLKRDKSLDTKETRNNHICAAFLREVDADVYAIAHATSPFATAEHIGECIRAVQTGKYDSAFCAEEIRGFFWQNGKPLNFDLKNIPRTQDMTPIYQEIATPLVFARETFIKHGSRTGINPYICPCTEFEAVDIDYPENFEFANLIYMSRKGNI
jgi:CMP-N-acetylneuraminic acid synthetase